MKEIIQTKNAPAAIGTYSQAIKVGNIVYLSGQIAIDPETSELLKEDMREQIQQVFRNLAAVAHAAGGTLANVVKLNIYLTDLGRFSMVNEIMAEFFSVPYPARAVIGVSELPKHADVEMDAIFTSCLTNLDNLL